MRDEILVGKSQGKVENRSRANTPETANSAFSLQPSALYSALTFRRLLDSLARPGKINQLANPAFLGEVPLFYSETEGREIPMNIYAWGAMFTLLDREVGAGLVAGGQWLESQTAAAHWLALRSGVRLVGPAEADFVLICDGHSGELLLQLNPGTLLEPENSATAIYCVEKLEAGQSRTNSGSAICVELAGPGIADSLTFCVSGLEPEELDAIKATRRQYPLGVDIYLIDKTGQCVGLPRTTRILCSVGNVAPNKRQG